MDVALGWLGWLLGCALAQKNSRIIVEVLCLGRYSVPRIEYHVLVDSDIRVHPILTYFRLSELPCH